MRAPTLKYWPHKPLHPLSPEAIRELRGQYAVWDTCRGRFREVSRNAGGDPAELVDALRSARRQQLEAFGELLGVIELRQRLGLPADDPYGAGLHHAKDSLSTATAALCAAVAAAASFDETGRQRLRELQALTGRVNDSTATYGAVFTG